jgi:hypothetical protein
VQWLMTARGEAAETLQALDTLLVLAKAEVPSPPRLHLPREHVLLR